MPGDKPPMNMGYGRFAAMIATSTVVMFGLMYLTPMRSVYVYEKMQPEAR